MSDACNYTRRLLGRRVEEECANSGARLFDQREGTEIYETSRGRRRRGGVCRERAHLKKKVLLFPK